MTDSVMVDPSERERLRRELGISDALARAATNYQVRRWNESTSGLLHAHLSKAYTSGLIDLSWTHVASVKRARRKVRVVGGTNGDLFPLPWALARRMHHVDARPHHTWDRRRTIVLGLTSGRGFGGRFLVSDGACPLREQALSPYRRVPAGVGFAAPLTAKQKRNRRRAQQRARAATRGE